MTEQWSIIGAYTYQDGEITRISRPQCRKARPLAELPKNTFSLWNRYDFTPMWGVRLGVV